jgi:hyaluronan synthase
MIRNGNLVLLQGVLFWVICAITQTAVYAIYRPGFTVRQRLGMWALSPIYPILGLVILRPAAYWALTKLKSTSWHTREVVVPSSVPSVSISPTAGSSLGAKGGKNKRIHL